MCTCKGTQVNNFEFVVVFYLYKYLKKIKLSISLHTCETIYNISTMKLSKITNEHGSPKWLSYAHFQCEMV